MTRPTIYVVLSAALALSFTACSGSGGEQAGSSLPVVAPDAQTVSDTADTLVARRTGSQRAKSAIEATNALGSRLRQLSAVSADAVLGSLHFSPTAATADAARLAHCEDGVEFFVPDRNGDPNSTEARFFYDVLCRQLALDDVRVYVSTGANSETVNHTDSLYVPDNATAIAARTGITQISNATFRAFGLPIVADGFAATNSSQLSIGGVPAATTAAEFVMMRGSQQVSQFCGDSAGYDPTGVASLDETFGYQGGVLSGGTRTTAGRGFVKWSATPSGTAFQGPIGSLSIATGTQNVSCPIATPDFTLNGGTAVGTYSIPISVVFHHAELWNLSVNNAPLPGGDTLNVTTNKARRQGNRAYVTGTVSNGNTSIATFSVNAFGNGTLTVTSTGAQYRIVDWTVIGS